MLHPAVSITSVVGVSLAQPRRGWHVVTERALAEHPSSIHIVLLWKNYPWPAALAPLAPGQA